MRNALTAFLGVCAILLAVAGQVVIANGEAVAGVLGAWPGPAAWVVATGLFPAGIGFGLGLVALGTLGTALALPAHPGRRAVAQGVVAHGHREGSRGSAATFIALFVAAASATVAAALLASAEPSVAAVVFWAVSLACGFAACASVDRRRGLHIGNPFSAREGLGVAVLALLCLALVAHDLGDWHWAGTPDESSFFIVARIIANGDAAPFLLSPRGVFGFQPVASSYYQALFMKVFGVNVVAWRLSSAVALATALPFLYLAVREVWSRRAALVAAAFLGSAQLSVGFAHYGYNNAQVFPVLTGALAALAWGTRERSLRGYYVAGCIAGLGFMTYYVALVAVPLVILAGFSLRRLSLRRGRRAEVVALAAPVFLFALPLLASPVESLSMAGHLALPEGDAAGVFSWAALLSREGPVFRALHHSLLSVVYGLWFSGPHHFQTNPVVDPLSGVLAAVGFWLGARALRQRSADAFLLPGYLVAAIMAGAVTPHPRPPLTRLLVLAPFTAMLAATALDRMLMVVKRHNLAAALASVVTAIVVVWNVATLHRSVYHMNHGYGDGTTAELIRVAEGLPAGHRIYYVQRRDTFMHNVPDVLEEYGLRERLRHLRRFDPAVLRILSEATPPFVVFYDLTDEGQRQDVEDLLRQRFPGMEWRDSAPGKPWNLPFFRVDEAL